MRKGQRAMTNTHKQLTILETNAELMIANYAHHASHCSKHLIFRPSVRSRCYYYPHFTDEKTKAQTLRNLLKIAQLVTGGTRI